MRLPPSFPHLFCERTRWRRFVSSVGTGAVFSFSPPFFLFPPPPSPPFSLPRFGCLQRITSIQKYPFPKPSFPFLRLQKKGDDAKRLHRRSRVTSPSPPSALKKRSPSSRIECLQKLGWTYCLLFFFLFSFSFFLSACSSQRNSARPIR